MEQLRDLLASAEDAMSVRRVFGEPIDKNDLTVIPAASIRGGPGGGAGKDRGSGQGYGLTARPLAYTSSMALTGAGLPPST